MPVDRSAPLRRELRLPEAVALSVGVMAPTAAMALNGAVPAGLVGRAVPLVFAVAALGAGLVAWSFVALTRRISHAGSVYALSGATLGPRAGFFSGGALLGKYLAFTVGSVAETGLFANAFLHTAGLPQVRTIGVALVALAAIALLAFLRVRIAARVLLGMEAVAIGLILVVCAVIYARLAAGTAPGGHHLSSAVFSLPAGTGGSAVGLAVVLAFISFAGFEGAAVLGEETRHPRRSIPRAIAGAVLGAAVLYMVCIVAQSLGFGATAAGAAAFSRSSAPLGQLAQTYVGSGMSAAVDLGATASAFASALATVTAGARLLYAISRDGAAIAPAARTSPRTGVPAVATALVLAVALAGLAGLAVNGTTGANLFFYPGTLAVLSLIAAYLLTCAGAVRLFWSRPGRGRAELLVPLCAIAFLAYALLRSVTGQPPPYDVFPWVAGAWLGVGLAAVVGVPGMARRIGEGLAERA